MKLVLKAIIHTKEGEERNTGRYGCKPSDPKMAQPFASNTKGTAHYINTSDGL